CVLLLNASRINAPAARYAHDVFFIRKLQVASRPVTLLRSIRRTFVKEVKAQSNFFGSLSALIPKGFTAIAKPSVAPDDLSIHSPAPDVTFNNPMCEKILCFAK